MNQSEFLWIMMWVLSIFTAIALVGGLIEIIHKYFFNKVEVSDLIARLDRGEELHSCNMFGDNHNFIGINDSDSYYCRNKGCKEIINSWEVNNGYAKIS